MEGLEHGISAEPLGREKTGSLEKAETLGKTKPGAQGSVKPLGRAKTGSLAKAETLGKTKPGAQGGTERLGMDVAEMFEGQELQYEEGYKAIRAHERASDGIKRKDRRTGWTGQRFEILQVLVLY